jgi:protein-disulfide isomerase
MCGVAQIEEKVGLRMKSWRAMLDVAVTAAMLAASAAVVWSVFRPDDLPSPVRPPAAQLPEIPVSLAQTPQLGSPDARLVLLIFSDFQCPFCARYASETLPVLKARYVDTGLLRFAFKHLPLPIHAQAVAAAEAGECAARQRAFWPMHDALFASTGGLSAASIVTAAEQLGLNSPAFRQCLNGEAADLVQRDAALARELGFDGTPTSLLGIVDSSDALRARHMILGARPVDDFATIIESLVAEEAKKPGLNGAT